MAMLKRARKPVATREGSSADILRTLLMQSTRRVVAILCLTTKETFGRLTPKKRLEAEEKANRPVLRIPSGCCGITFAHCKKSSMEYALSCGLRERGTKNRATLSPHLLACKSGRTECTASMPQLHLLPFQDAF